MELTQQIVRELISYDPVTGNCHWRERDVKWFADGKYPKEREWKRWNSRYAAKPLLSVHETGYIRIDLFSKNRALHRLIWLYMTGDWPDQVDHIDGNTLNNRWDNLRNVDFKENMKNRKRNKNNTSGVMGVVWYKPLNKWVASIYVNGKNKHLGYFPCIAHAVRARKEAEIKYGFHPNHGRK